MNDITQGGTILLLLNGFGAALKRIPKFPDWLIPFVLPAAGAIGNCAMEGHWNGPVAISGMVLGMAAVGGNQMLRQGVEVVREKTGNTAIIEKPPTA